MIWAIEMGVEEGAVGGFPAAPFVLWDPLWSESKVTNWPQVFQTGGSNWWKGYDIKGRKKQRKDRKSRHRGFHKRG